MKFAVYLFILLAGINLPSGAQDTGSNQESPHIDTLVIKRDREDANRIWSMDTVRIFGLMFISGRKNHRNFAQVLVDSVHRANRYHRNVRTNFLVLDLGVNNYIDRTPYYPDNYAAYASSPVYNLAPRTPAQGPVTASEFRLVPQKSVNVNIWIFLQKVNLIHHVVNLQYGLGAEMNNFRYENNISYVPGYQTTIIRDSVGFRKNKLFTEYLTVPLMLNFETNPFHHKRSFQISFGVSGGYLFKSRTKQISQERGKVKDNDAFNLDTWRGSLIGEIGFGNIKFYGSYSLTPLHQNGLVQYPFSVGIRLLDGL
ncbi:MAG TPA: outer membrane beta-barrel protein [Chitinophagaceae bacterium]|nr:outer membrane beta-barrel protein [Chitinophagaceae bacterium]